MEQETGQEIMNEMEPVAQAAEEISQPIAKTKKKTAAEEPEPKKSNKRVLQGKVFSNKADKTIVVKIVRQVAHPLYKKYYKKTKKIMAHDEKNECKTGDTVKVKECRPLSRNKRWELVEIVEKAK